MLLLLVRRIRWEFLRFEKNGTRVVVRFVMWSSARLSSISPMQKLVGVRDESSTLVIWLSMVSWLMFILM